MWVFAVGGVAEGRCAGHEGARGLSRGDGHGKRVGLNFCCGPGAEARVACAVSFWKRLFVGKFDAPVKTPPGHLATEFYRKSHFERACYVRQMPMRAAERDAAFE